MNRRGTGNRNSRDQQYSGIIISHKPIDSRQMSEIQFEEQKFKTQGILATYL